MVGLGTSKGNAECYCKSPDISPGKSQDNRATSYSKKKPLRKQKAYAAEEDTDDEGEEIVGLVVNMLYLLIEDATGLIILVQLVTCVIMKNSDQIIGLEMPQKITVGDGHSVQATGRGDVILRMNLPNGNIQKCKLSDVLYVPDLLHNLLSVSKAASNGKSFEFGQSHCNIVDNKFGVVVTASKCRISII